MLRLLTFGDQIKFYKIQPREMGINGRQNELWKTNGINYKYHKLRDDISLRDENNCFFNCFLGE